jgi:UDP-N-acetylglucosamine/UDP-N-acetylgalactosamine 4-epimerase
MNNKMTDKKILVTGGAGFIGSNLIESFLAAGNDVSCLDNYSTGRKENIEMFAGNSRFRMIEGDIRDLDACKESVRNIDIVFHQAALGSVPRSIADPVTTTDVNIGGFVKMLFASREAKVKRFIYAASSSTYGDSAELPKREEKIGKPLSPYAVTKLADELFAENFSSVYGIDVIGLRYFNVFGRRQDPDGPYAAVIPRFLQMLRNHQRPVINGDGLHSRDFTYVDNVVMANRLAAEVADKAALNQVYNVACGERTTLKRMFELLRSFAARYDKAVMNIEPVYGPERAGDIPHSHASIEKAVKLLGYNPGHNIEKGLSEAVEWYWENLK